MLDVHPPHEPIHGWRDFLLHLIAITIGLLIALSLESLVEWNHHRHLAREEHVTLHEEFETNHRMISQNMAALRSDEERIKSDLKQLVTLRSGHKIEHGALGYTVSWSSFSDSAWKTAQSSGAVLYIDFRQTQELAEVYVQQDFVVSSATQIFRNQTLAIHPCSSREIPTRCHERKYSSAWNGRRIFCWICGTWNSY